LTIFAALALCAACSSPLIQPADAGAPDSGSSALDAGSRDAGHDAGFADAGPDDAGSADAGTLDAGSADAGNDAGASDAGAGDAGMNGGSVGYGGGTVDLLDFAITGDSRPPFCDLVSNYPDAIVKAEAAQMAALPAQFAVDLGDHMFACLAGSGGPLASTAATQMQKYVAAVSGYPKPWFMSMGNHECLDQLDCSGQGLLDPNYAAFYPALGTVSHQDLPYYSVDIRTRPGLVRLVFVADNFASQEQQLWLPRILADADQNAVHTIVLKHHPYKGDTGPGWPWPAINAHRVSLLLTAHEHLYEHDTTALGGRTVVCGLGGANTANTGFCRVQQREDNSLAFTEYDLSGNPRDTWSVPPLPH